MTIHYKPLLCGAALLGMGLSLTGTAHAQHHNHQHHQSHDHAQTHAHHGINVSGGGHDGHVHASTTPAGIMGDHVHEKGGWMVSYSVMRMEMKDNRDGTDSLSPLEISGDFANVTGVGPSTLRIVPTEMTMDMHMLGAMYGITDKLTVMGMANYIRKDMDHITFAGGNPDLQIAEFTTRTSGFGDTKLAALYEVAPSVVLKAGVSLPTGSLKEEDEIINPMGVLQTIRLPYAMQLGSGTYDFEPAVTYSGHHGDYGWGAQYTGIIRLGENDQDYTLGDKHKVNVWGSYSWTNSLSNSLRLSLETEEDISGQDSNIAGPVQTANPDNYGGERIEVGFGVSYGGTGTLKGHQLQAEFTLPIYQDLNGPQMERHYGLIGRYRYTF